MNLRPLYQALQAQAWERAKAELHSIAAVDHSPTGSSDEHVTWNEWAEKCERRRKLFDEFIKTVEDEELHL